jgi:hypothetical protein
VVSASGALQPVTGAGKQSFMLRASNDRNRDGAGVGYAPIAVSGTTYRKPPWLSNARLRVNKTRGHPESPA